MRRPVVALVLSALLLAGCGSSSSKSKETKLEGFRWKVTLVRAADESSWAEVKGSQEWWFFSANVFRQISTDYVEPQFYGDNQACNGAGSGSWTFVDAAEGEETGDRKQYVSVVYDGVKDVRGLCRMTDRTLQATLQPSGVVDVLDARRAVRLEKIEAIQ